MGCQELDVVSDLTQTNLILYLLVLLLLFWCWFEKVLVFSLFFFLFGFLFVVFYFLKGMVVMMLIKSVRFKHSKSMV